MKRALVGGVAAGGAALFAAVELAIESGDLEGGVLDALVELAGEDLDGGSLVVRHEAAVLHGDDVVGHEAGGVRLDRAVGQLGAVGVGGRRRSLTHLTRSSMAWFWAMEVPMPERSKSSVVVPTYQPRFSSPRRSLRGCGRCRRRPR